MSNLGSPFISGTEQTRSVESVSISELLFKGVPSEREVRALTMILSLPLALPPRKAFASELQVAISQESMS